MPGVAGRAGRRRRSSRDVQRRGMVPPGQHRLTGSPLAVLQHILPQLLPGCQLQHARGAAGRQGSAVADSTGRQEAAGSRQARSLQAAPRTLPQAASRAARISSSLCLGTFMRRPGLQRPSMIEIHSSFGCGGGAATAGDSPAGMAAVVQCSGAHGDR